MNLVYCGAHVAVELAETAQLAERGGDPIDVPDDVARRLLDEQPDNWKSADAKPPQKGGK